MRSKLWLGSGWAVVLLLAVALWGCGSEDGVTTPDRGYSPPPVGSGAGLLAVEIESFGSLNDGLGTVFAAADGDSGHGRGHHERTPLAALYVTFDAIRVFPACEDSLDDDDDGGMDSTMAAARYGPLDDGDDGPEDDDCGYVEFAVDPPVTVDVAGLDSTLTEVLGALELPMGDYTHLAVKLADAWVVTAEGDSVEASLPGGDKNWLKVIVPFTVEDGQVTAVVIAFDLSRSIVEAPPGSGNFKIKPVLHGHVGWDDDHGGEGGHQSGEHDDGQGGEGGEGGQGGDGGQGGHDGHI